jgi:hypothetical protein
MGVQCLPVLRKGVVPLVCLFFVVREAGNSNELFYRDCHLKLKDKEAELRSIIKAIRWSLCVDIFDVPG